MLQSSSGFWLQEFWALNIGSSSSNYRETEDIAGSVCTAHAQDVTALSFVVALANNSWMQQF
jgi:hypothetical protein